MNWRCCWPVKEKKEETQPFKISVKDYYNLKFKTR